MVKVCWKSFLFSVSETAMTPSDTVRSSSCRKHSIRKRYKSFLRVISYKAGSHKLPLMTIITTLTSATANVDRGALPQCRRVCSACFLPTHPPPLKRWLPLSTRASLQPGISARRQSSQRDIYPAAPIHLQVSTSTARSNTQPCLLRSYWSINTVKF